MPFIRSAICCLLSCSVCPCCAQIYMAMTRTKIRNKYGIPGSCKEDCCIHAAFCNVCCCCLPITQEAMEARLRYGTVAITTKPDFQAMMRQMEAAK